MHANTFRSLLFTAALMLTSSLASVSAEPFESIEITSEQVLSSYQKIHIAPVEVTLVDDEPKLLAERRRSSYVRSQPPVDERDQARKAEDLHKQLTHRFASQFTLVSSPAEDVLTISTKITRMLPSRPTSGQRRRGVGALGFGSSVSAGGVDYAVTMSASGVQFYSITESYRSNLNDGLPRTGVWQDADRSFDRFSRQLLHFVRSN